MQGTNTNDLRNIISTISTKLHKNDIASEIHYRLKDPCSALKKVLRKTIALKELTDLIAFRIIVDKKEDCYKVLDIIYNIYSVNVEKSKNYIANPKDNGYRSLHVIVVVGIYERNVEIQIRSRKMHNTAESGTASHDEYKKMQEAKLRKLLSNGGLNTADINTEINNAYNIFSRFNWTISELIAYEQAIESLCHNLHNVQLSKVIK
ncbi:MULTISPECIES: bifunctional (p)ppGpp synthetase/guanosine-3',5'-bis(diphosphate) 3'-pyrophosphohydrolase [unclassified Candidatus Tisiphia]|uniref:bifunctional (p)ppGpp synthetase/guanosine-3',5'-bis(diphosphate) 3'-pyrophosphohydrolase n=1 Tax=unclassified Candidatus Tisiphia TaxID=2996318 RepID=UPI00312C7D1A